MLSAAEKRAARPHLDLLKQELRNGAYPEYPTQRLIVPYNKLARVAGKLSLPDGPWTVNQHENRRKGDRETTPEAATQRRLQKQGFELDTQGRPVHPWFELMVGDAALGVILGKGSYWDWGPNRTADPVSMQGDNVLLTQRKDSRTWALPGGFVEDGDSADKTGRLETCQETGVRIPKYVRAISCYKGPVADLRIAQGWPVTEVLGYLIPKSETLARPTGSDETLRSAWVPKDEALQMKLFGSHNILLRQAVELIG